MNKKKQWEEYLSVTRKALLTDRYLLAKFLGYDDAEHRWDKMQIHILRDAIPSLEKQGDYRAAFFAPRGTFKTAIEEVSIIGNILANSSVTIALGSWKLDVTERICKNVMRHLENPLLIALFPDVLYEDPKNKSPQWSTTKGFVVKRPAGIREETLSTFSIESMATSRHFGKIYVDDAVEQRNTQTNEAIEKTKDILQDLPSLLINLHGSIEVRGTFWDTEDWYVKKILPSTQWRVFRAGARIDEAAFNPFEMPVGELTFPQCLDEEKLRELQGSMTRFHYETQYLLRADNVEGSGHLPGKPIYFDVDQTPIKNQVMILCDPGTGTETSSKIGREPDDTSVMVLTTMGNDSNYKLLILDGAAYLMGWSEMADWLYLFYEEYGGISLIEEIGQAKSVEDTLFQKAKEKGKVLPHIPITHQVGGGIVKERIKNLEPFYARNRVWSLDPQTIDTSSVRGQRKKEFFQKYEHQHARWDKVPQDGILDVLEMGATRLVPKAAALSKGDNVDFSRHTRTRPGRRPDFMNHARVV